jgi:hypothetical protein
VTEIIKFPAKNERLYRELDGAILEALQRAGAPANAVEWVREDIKKRLQAADAETWLELSVDLNSAGGVQSAIEGVVQFFHDAMSKMVVQILSLEIELFFARNR